MRPRPVPVRLVAFLLVASAGVVAALPVGGAGVPADGAMPADGAAPSVGVVASGGAVPPAGGALHSVNYVSLDSQVSANGTVTVEGAFIERSGWVVLHEPAEGDERLGDPLGVTRFRTVNRFVPDVAVAIDGGRWRNWSAREVVVVLHGEDGDGEFTSADPPLAGFGTVVRDAGTVARGDRALVTAEGDFPQRTDGPRVTLRRVALPADGAVVLRNRTADGRVVGVRALDAGAHRNVTVALNRSFYDARPGTFALHATLVRGANVTPATAGAAEPVRAGDAPVTTVFRARPVSAGGAVVTTPASTATPATATPSPTATASRTATGTDTSSGSGPGFGAVAAALAVILAALAAEAAAGRRP